MKIPRTCKVCGNNFIAIKVTQFFCCRRCFKRSYYMRTRSKVKKAENAPTFPIKKCSYCEEITHLTFDPVKIPKLFNNWSCPKCGVTNQMIWENQNDRNSYEMISNIMISYQITASVAVQQTRYEVFKLPLPSLEEGNADIVTMACEVLNILDIQKKGRKKIIFS